jgi:hypothetical protein
MGEMAELGFYSGFDYNEAVFGDRGGRGGHASTRNPLYYSRRAAMCAACETQYDKLWRAVSKTAAAARRDGWQIERAGDRYRWYCPDCKAAHDFAGDV